MGRAITSIGAVAPDITDELLTFEADFSNANALNLFGPQGYPWLYSAKKGNTGVAGGYVTQLKNNNNEWADVTQEPSGMGRQLVINDELQYYCRDSEVTAYNLPTMKFIENGELVMRNHLTPDNFKDVAITAVDKFGDFEISSIDIANRLITVEGHKYSRKRPSDDATYARGDYIGFDRFLRDELIGETDLDLSWKRKKYAYGWVNVQTSAGWQKKVKYDLVADTEAVDPTVEEAAGIPTTHVIRIMEGELSAEEWIEIAAGGVLKLFRRLPWIGQMMTTGGTFSQKYFICEAKMKLGDHAEQFFAMWFWGNYLKMFGQDGFPDYNFDVKHSNATELDGVENPGGGHKSTRHHTLHAAGVGGMLNYAAVNNIPQAYNKGIEWDKDEQAGHQNLINEISEGFVNYQDWFTLQVRWIPPYHPQNLRKIGIVEWYISQGDDAPRYLCGAITPPWWDADPGLAKQLFINNAVGGTFVNDSEFSYSKNEGSTLRGETIENRIKYVKFWQYPGYTAGGSGYPDRTSEFSRGMLPTPYDLTGNSGTGVVSYGSSPPPPQNEGDPVIDPVTGRIRTLIKKGSAIRTNNANASIEQLQQSIAALKIEMEADISSKISTGQAQALLAELEADLQYKLDTLEGTIPAATLNGYELWITIPGNENKTLTEYFASLKGDPGDIGIGTNAALSSDPNENDSLVAANTVATQILDERITAAIATAADALTAYDAALKGGTPSETLVTLRTDVDATLTSIVTIFQMISTDVEELDTVNERIAVIQALIDDINALGDIPDGFANIIEEIVNTRTDKGLPMRVPADGFPAGHHNYWFAWSESGTADGIEVEAGKAYSCTVNDTPINTPANWERAYGHDFVISDAGTNAEKIAAPAWIVEWYVNDAADVNNFGSWAKKEGVWTKKSVTSNNAYGTIYTLTSAAFAKPECPFTQSDPLDSATRTYPEARAAILAAGGGVDSQGEYVTPKGGAKYIFRVLADDGCLCIEGTHSPIYRFTSDINPAIAPQVALTPSEVAVGFNWFEIDIRKAAITLKLCMATDVIETEWVSDLGYQNTVYVLADTDFTYPEFPFEQTDAVDASTRSYAQVSAAMLAAEAVPGDIGLYTTPKGKHRYLWQLQLDNSITLIEAPEIPLYRYTFNLGVTEAALVSTEVAKGALWEELEIASGKKEGKLATSNEVITTEWVLVTSNTNKASGTEAEYLARDPWITEFDVTERTSDYYGLWKEDADGDWVRQSYGNGAVGIPQVVDLETELAARLPDQVFNGASTLPQSGVAVEERATELQGNIDAAYQVAADYAAARLLAPSASEKIIITHSDYYGEFVCLAGAAPNNDGIDLDCATAGHYLKRVYTGNIQFEWFEVNQTAVDVAALHTLEFKAGVIETTPLVYPSSGVKWIGQGKSGNQTQLKLKAEYTNVPYMVASSTYVNNSTTGSEPSTFTDIYFNGDQRATYPFICHGYRHSIRGCAFRYPKTGGASFLLTSVSANATQCTTTLVENELERNEFDGSGIGMCFDTLDTGAKLTDKVITNNHFYGGDMSVGTMAGSLFEGNHCYSGVAKIKQLSSGSRVANNYFENTVEFDDFKVESVTVSSGNTFLGNVKVMFGATGKTFRSVGNAFIGSAQLTHSYFAGDRVLYSTNDHFAFSDLKSRILWNNGSSTGIVRVEGATSLGGAGSLTRGGGIAAKNSYRLYGGIVNASGIIKGTADVITAINAVYPTATTLVGSEVEVILSDASQGAEVGTARNYTMKLIETWVTDAYVRGWVEVG